MRRTLARLGWSVAGLTIAIVALYLAALGVAVHALVTWQAPYNPASSSPVHWGHTEGIF